MPLRHLALTRAPSRHPFPRAPLQVNYPRSGPIRWKWLARRLAELAVMLTVSPTPSLPWRQALTPAPQPSQRARARAPG